MELNYTLGHHRVAYGSKDRVVPTIETTEHNNCEQNNYQ